MHLHFTISLHSSHKGGIGNRPKKMEQYILLLVMFLLKVNVIIYPAILGIQAVPVG